MILLLVILQACLPPLFPCAPPPPPPPGDDPPTFIGGLSVINPTRTTITLQWDRADDEEGITGYRLFVDRRFVASTGPAARRARFWHPCGGKHYTVEAVDSSGQRAPQSRDVRRRPCKGG